MNGQMWGGGIIVVVAVALWLLYLLPSWHRRHQFDAAERNAVRLNQALRVLAETSETPEEVRLELNARTALAQQRLARRSLAEREEAELAQAKAEAETARALAHAELEAARVRAKTEAEAARALARAEMATMRAEAADAREQAARRTAAARAMPAARRARARRGMRLTATVLVVLGLSAVGAGVWMLLASGAQTLLWAGGAAVFMGAVVVVRMARVAAHAGESAASVTRVVPQVQDVALPAEPAKPTWQPRQLPKPLASSAGSRAAAVLDGAAAREALREAALEEAKREKAAEAAPPAITPRRVVAAPFAAMGYVDDAEIEAHVRQLLANRRAG